jgi:hypothetical protein
MEPYPFTKKSKSKRFYRHKKHQNSRKGKPKEGEEWPLRNTRNTRKGEKRFYHEEREEHEEKKHCAPQKNSIHEKGAGNQNAFSSPRLSASAGEDEKRPRMALRPLRGNRNATQPIRRRRMAITASALSTRPNVAGSGMTLN